MSFEGAQQGCVGPITSCTKEPYGSLKGPDSAGAGRALSSFHVQSLVEK